MKITINISVTYHVEPSKAWAWIRRYLSTRLWPKANQKLAPSTQSAINTDSTSVIEPPVSQESAPATEPTSATEMASTIMTESRTQSTSVPGALTQVQAMASDDATLNVETTSDTGLTLSKALPPISRSVAAPEVFGIGELVEMILLGLRAGDNAYDTDGARTILFCRRVNKFLRATIEGSRKLEDELCLRSFKVAHRKQNNSTSSSHLLGPVIPSYDRTLDFTPISDVLARSLVFQMASHKQSKAKLPFEVSWRASGECKGTLFFWFPEAKTRNLSSGSWREMYILPAEWLIRRIEVSWETGLAYYPPRSWVCDLKNATLGKLVDCAVFSCKAHDSDFVDR